MRQPDSCYSEIWGLMNWFFAALYNGEIAWEDHGLLVAHKDELGIEIGDQLIAPRPKSDQTDGADVTDTEYYYLHLPLLVPLFVPLFVPLLACISAI